MANERLADLTPSEAYEIANRDPRVVLMERLHGHPEAKRDLEAVVRKHKTLFPNGNVPEDPKELAREAIKDDLESLRALKKEVEDERKERRHSAFRASIIESGAEEADVDKIEQFMLDNEFGTKPAAIKKAVEAYYEANAPAEPNATSGLVWDPPGADAKLMKELLTAGPEADLDQVAAPYYEQVFAEMTRGPRAQRPAMA